MIQKKLLIGNSFPLTLIRREVKIEVENLEVFKGMCQQAEIHSFWGHENTRTVAEMVLGVSVKPKVERPAIALTAAGLPTLNGETFTEGYILSPNYKKNVRPKIGEEVAAEQIASWHLLKISWIGSKEIA